MIFKDFSFFLNNLEQTSGRTEMTKIISEFIKDLKDNEIKYTMYLIQGRLVPKYIDLEFNISAKLILRSLEKVILKFNSSDTSESITKDNTHNVDLEKAKEIIKATYSKLGDVGSTSQEIIKQYHNTNNIIENSNFEVNLTITEVYNQLKEIALSTGKGSQEDKMNKYINLVSSLDSLSVRYATRIIIGTIRLGISDKTILDALSWFINGDKSLRKNLDTAFGSRADVGEIATLLIENKEQDIKNLLDAIKVKVGTPVASKLVEREASSQAVWVRMPDCFVQPKLDGLRGQIHYSKNIDTLNDPALTLDIQNINTVDTNNPSFFASIFSRNMENMSQQYPEIIKAVNQLKIDSIILDSEIIGYNQETLMYMSYQDTMKRKRKYEIEEYAKSIPVKAMCFDILYLNGEDLTHKPIEERIKLLKEILSRNPNSALEMLETKQIKSEIELEEYFKSKVENGLEGIITKEKESIYEPGTRNFKWIKLKANTRSDLVDTIDVAILGYYIGKGDRSRFGFGALLAGVYNPEDDKYYSIGKVGSGFKEEDMPSMLKDMESLKNNKLVGETTVKIPNIESEEKGLNQVIQPITKNQIPENYVVDKMLYPDIWIMPNIIVEIDADEITRSPNHTAARGLNSNVLNDDSSKGLSIRFPRMKKWKRDKDYPNTVNEIIRMYELRKNKVRNE